MSSTSAAPAGKGTVLSDRRLAAFGVVLIVDFVIDAVMLVTDKNLQTNFGAQGAYFSHWYGVLAMAIINLLVGVTLVAASSLPALKTMSTSARRAGVIAALLWTIIALVASVGIVSSYSQVGLTMSQFEQYLFGVTAYKGALPYIPGLYDALIALYVVTAIVGVVAVMKVPASAAGSGTRQAA
jgi:hypothetical protein